MCRGEVGSQMVWSREAGRRRGRAWERWMRARSSKKERTGVCDVIQSPLSPLPHTHTVPAFGIQHWKNWSTLKLSMAEMPKTHLHKHTTRAHAANRLKPMYITLTSGWLFPFILGRCTTAGKVFHPIQPKL